VKTRQNRNAHGLFVPWAKKERKYQVLLLLLAVMCLVFGMHARAGSEGIIINEIQISGGAGKATQDYVELYNESDKPIKLEGWQLKRKTTKFDKNNLPIGFSEDSVRVFKKGAVIPAKGYYLWASKSMELNFIADEISSTASIISDSSIALFDKDKKVIDQVAWGSGHINPFVEKEAFMIPSGQPERIERKNFQDTDDNSQDFHILVTGTPTASGCIDNPDDPKCVVPGDDSVQVTQGKIDMDKNVYVNTYANFEIQKNADEKVTWDFGDGHKSYLAKTRHKYIAEGTYAASVKIYIGKDNAIQQFSVEVKKYPHPKIQIVEVKANPKGSDAEGETITVLNKSKKTLNLNGWSVASGAKKKLTNHPIKTDVKIKKKKTKVITKDMSKFSLNNKKGKIELRYPDGKVASKIKYDHGKISIADDEVYQKVKGGWEWTGGTQDIITNLPTGGQDINNNQAPITNVQPDINTENTTQNVPAEEPETQAILTPIEIPVQKYKVELAVANVSPEPQVLGAETVREDGDQYFFTPPSKQPQYYAVTFFEYLISVFNSSLNFLFNKVI